MATKSNITPPVEMDHERVVIDENGTTAILRGFGWAKNQPMDLDPRVDLTRPIWEQVQKLRRLDKRAPVKAKAAA